MPPVSDGRPSEHPTATAWLTDWLETGPIRTDGLRTVLLVGEPATAQLLATRLPAADVTVADRHTPVGGEFDLVALVDARAVADPSELRAAAGALRGDGTLLVLTGGHPAGSAGFVPAGWDAATVGLQLVAFDDLTDGATRSSAPPRRWLRATYRRVGR
jgi:hypothetical protein